MLNRFMDAHLVFVLLAVLSLLKPLNGVHANRYFSVVLLAVMFVLFCHKFCQLSLLKKLWQTAAVKLLLVVAFFLVCLIALIRNHGNYQPQSEIILFALPDILVASSFLICYFLYQHYGSRQHYLSLWLAWALWLALGLMALWQIWDYPRASLLSRYFVSQDSIRPGLQVISSFTRWHTIYGSIAAVSVLVLLRFAHQSSGIFSRIFYLLLAGLFFYTGLMGQSRNFLWIIAIGLGLYFLYFMSRHWKYALLILLVSVSLVHVLLISSDRLYQEYRPMLPYLSALKQGEIPSTNALLPRINNHTLNDRWHLWQQGLQLWQQHRWLGIGPGAYRALHDQDRQQRNLHNFYLQTLVEKGIIGLLLLTIWLLFIMRQAYRQGHFIILAAILSSLVFDNYLDYSFAWVIIMSWLLWISSTKEESHS